MNEWVKGLRLLQNIPSPLILVLADGHFSLKKNQRALGNWYKIWFSN